MVTSQGEGMLEVGYSLFGCEIIRPISENGAYESYLVRCQDRTSAKMFVALRLSRNDAGLDAFLQLANRHVDVDFPSVGLPFRVGEQDGHAACLYPLPDGQALIDSRVGNRLSVRETLDFLRKLASLLVKPHNAGLVHGNLSPSTVYLHDKDLCLDDFALSLLLKLDYQTGINPAYTSPEQVRGESPSPASDIYNLGAIFYYLLSGVSPFSGGDAFAISMKHLQDVFPQLPEGHCCADLLSAMTRSQANERPTAETLIGLIDQLLETQDVDQPQPLLTTTSEPEVTAEEDIENGLDLSNEENHDFTARIEARLKEQSYALPDSEETLPLADEGTLATEGLDQLPAQRKNSGWRYLLILVLGVLLGSGLYMGLSGYLPESLKSTSVEKENSGETLDLALSAWRNGDSETAIALLEAMKDERADDPRPANNLAAIFAAQGDYDQARSYLEQALQTSAEYTTVYENLAAIYAEMARESYGKALQLDDFQTSVQLAALSSQGVVRIGSGSTTSNDVPDTGIATTPEEGLLSDTGENELGQVVANSDDAQAEEDVVVASTSPFAVDSTESATRETEQATSVAGVVDIASADDVGDASLEPAPESAEDFMSRWAAAWSAQDVDLYLSFYGEDFVPPAGMKRGTWEQQRQVRIAKPQSIVVDISAVVVEERGDGARVELVQGYKSDVFADRTRKIFDLKRSGQEWSIVRERSLGSVL